MSWWRKLLAWSIFPIVFGGALCVAAGAIRVGLPPALALPVIFPFALVIMLAERIQPHASQWNHARGDVMTDAKHVVFSQFGASFVVDSIVQGVFVVAGAALAHAIGAPLWPTRWPLALQLLLALLVAELGQYWWHRLCHEHELFWRLHATHHSPARLYFLNASRAHPFDISVAYLAHLIPLAVLGAPPAVFALFSVATVIHGMFQHANIELRLGPLNWLFSMAELHRWHHSRNIEDANGNYGANLIVWDVVFGTRSQPGGREHDPDDVGFEDMHRFPSEYLGQLAAPFRWNRIFGTAQVDRTRAQSSLPEQGA